MERITSNARYAVGNSDGCEEGAPSESSISNARYAVSCTVVSNGFGDDNFAGIFVRVFIRITSPVSHCQIVFIEDVVAYMIHFKVMCQEACGGENSQEKSK